MTPHTFSSPTVLTVVFAVGACVGSFLNVCIHRIPRGKSIVFPGSFCPGCGHSVPFYLNIPILSYFMLKGRCNHCHAAFSIRYPVVETLSAFFAVAAFLSFGPTAQGLLWFVFISTLTVISFIDYDFQIIPDMISLPGTLIFAAASVAVGYHSWHAALTGILAGGGSLYLVAAAYHFIRKEEGMGGGDIKLLAMIGAATGWQGVLFTLFAGSCAGTLAGTGVMIISRSMNPKLKIPFGPYLSMGALLYLFKGRDLINWYFGLLR